MIISIGSDHAGFELRKALIERLEAAGFTLIDRGPDDSEPVDYPDYAKTVAEDVLSKKADLGVLVCGTGIGISISANKIKGIRAALAYNEDSATYARKHNDANIICLGGKYHSPEFSEKLIKIFSSTDFDGGRHQRRVNKIMEQETC